ncbi:MAG: M6 family metalloprotease domain-containing protein, partial [Bacteroidales bacterium]|nr:M6 family metalloprotease domain-containing protein [Bacteroidales bacterium]
DNDNDNVVDGVAIIHQGRGQESSGDTDDIWSHSWTLSAAGYSSSQRTFDGVRVNEYTAQPELLTTTTMSTIGVLCHEFGHNLGLPDFYDTDYNSNGRYAGTGDWDVMASGSWNGNPAGSSPPHHNAWSKTFLGWVNPTVIRYTGNYTLNNYEQNAQVYRYETTTNNEYFLIENRQRTGYDADIPGHGMLIYHVDGNHISSHMNSNNINIGRHQGLYPVCANATGNPPSNYGNINSAGCPFPGTGNRTQFTDNTTPHARSWRGNNSNRPITNITETGNRITFDISIPCNAVPNKNDRTLTGDVNGDGRDELILLNTSYCGGAIRVIDVSTGGTLLWVNHRSFGGWMDNSDKAMIGDVDGNGKDDLILVNTGYSGGAIRAINLTTGGTIKWINHGSFGGWMDASDKMFVGDVNGDNKEDLVLVNTGYSGGAIRAINITTGGTIKWINHGSFGGWMDAKDRAFLGDVNGDKKEDLVLVNTAYSGGAIRAINVTTGGTIKWINHGSFGGWMDAKDRAYLGDVNGDSKEDLVLVNTGYSGGAIRAINITTGGTIKWINHGSFGGWMDSSDRSFLGDVNSDNKDDLILVNTGYSGGAIRAVNITSGGTIKWINHGGYGGWMDAKDRMLIMDANADNKMDLTFINTSYTHGAILIKNIITDKNLAWFNHSNMGLGGWLDGYDENTSNNTTLKSTEIEEQEPMEELLSNKENELVQFYPNPVVNELIINSRVSEGNVIGLSLANLAGKVIYKSTESEFPLTIDLSN